MAGFPVQDGDIRVSWIWWVLSQTHHIDSCIWTIFSWKKPKNCLSHSHTSGRGEKPVEVGGRAGHRLTKTPHSDLDLEDIWRPAFSLGWKLQAARFSPFFSSLVGSPSPPLYLAAACGFSQTEAMFLVSWVLQQGPRGYLWISGSGVWTGGPTRLCIFAYFQSCCLGGGSRLTSSRLTSSPPWGGLQTDFQSAWISVLPRFLNLRHPCLGKPSITRNHSK